MLKKCCLGVFKMRALKLISFKNNPKPPSNTQNLQDSAPHFGAYLPEIWGQIRVSDGGFGLFIKEMSFD